MDNAGIDGLAGVVAEPQPLHRLRPHVVEHHVSGFDKAHAGFKPALLLEIQHDTPLVAVRVQKERAHAGFARQADQPGRIAAGGFDLDDVRTEVPEDLRSGRAEQNRR